MHHRLSSPFFSSAAVNSFPRLFLPSVLGPSLHPSASASTRDAPICHLPAAFAEHYGSITHSTWYSHSPHSHSGSSFHRTPLHLCADSAKRRINRPPIIPQPRGAPPQSINTLYSTVGTLHCASLDTGLDRHGQFPATARRATSTQARPRCRCRWSRVGRWQSCPPFGRRAPGQPGPGLASRPSTQSARRASRHGAAAHSWLPFTAPAAAAAA